MYEPYGTMIYAGEKKKAKGWKKSEKTEERRS